MDHTETTTAFNEGQYAGVYPDGIENHYWTLARNAILMKTVREALGNGGGLVLDVGCGRGITIDYLRRRGVEVLGCDLGTAKPICPEVGPYVLPQTDALQLPLDVRTRVKVVMLLDVLEHLPEPAAFLTELALAFPHCHSVIITVPARMEVWSNYDVFNGHFKRYAFESSPDLYDRSLFEVRWQTYLFHLLYPAARILLALGNNRNVEIKPPRGPALWIHRLVAACFRIEYTLLPKRIYGTSLMLVLGRQTQGKRP